DRDGRDHHRVQLAVRIFLDQPRRRIRAAVAAPVHRHLLPRRRPLLGRPPHRQGDLRGLFTLPWRGRVARLSASEGERGGVTASPSKITPPRLATLADPPPPGEGDHPFKYFFSSMQCTPLLPLTTWVRRRSAARLASMEACERDRPARFSITSSISRSATTTQSSRSGSNAMVMTWVGVSAYGHVSVMSSRAVRRKRPTRPVSIALMQT